MKIVSTSPIKRIFYATKTLPPWLATKSKIPELDVSQIHVYQSEDTYPVQLSPGSAPVYTDIPRPTIEQINMVNKRIFCNGLIPHFTPEKVMLTLDQIKIGDKFKLTQVEEIFNIEGKDHVFSHKNRFEIGDTVECIGMADYRPFIGYAVKLPVIATQINGQSSLHLIPLLWLEPISSEDGLCKCSKEQVLNYGCICGGK